MESEELDFEEKINKNREILKVHRKKKENEDNNNKINKVERKIPPKSKPNKNRN